MPEPGWKKEYLEREAQFELPSNPADEPPATEQPSVDCPHLMVLMPHSTWLAVVNANLALTADNARMEKNVPSRFAASVDRQAAGSISIVGPMGS